MSQKPFLFHSRIMKTRQNSTRGFILPLLFILVVIAIVAVGYIYLVLKWSYSEGERAGVVQKFSKKGWLCKTWEGELNMVVLPGALPEKFFFTVWDETVATDINRHVGKRVALHYVEKVGLPTSCFGDTRYYIHKVRSAAE